jgi:hypothetical protein
MSTDVNQDEATKPMILNPGTTGQMNKFPKTSGFHLGKLISFANEPNPIKWKSQHPG